MEKVKIFASCLLIFLFSQPSFGGCHYIKKDGNNFYYNNSNGDVFDFYPVERSAIGLSIAGIKDKYNIGLKHSEGSNIFEFFSCNNGCRIITESYIEMYGFLRGSLIDQKQVLRNPATILGSAMTDDINGCMEKQDLENKEKSREESKSFFNDIKPSSATEKARREISELPDGQ